RGGMLEGDHDHPGKIGSRPALEQRLPRNLALANVWLRCAGLLGESQRRAEREMSLLVSHGIVRIRVSVISFGQQDRGSQIHGLSPKGGEELALDLHVTDVFGVWRDLGRADFVV